MNIVHLHLVRDSADGTKRTWDSWQLRWNYRIGTRRRFGRYPVKYDSKSFAWRQYGGSAKALAALRRWANTEGIV